MKTLAIADTLNKVGDCLNLQPGASQEDLDLVAQLFNVTLPSGFRDLYAWRNGQAPDSADSFAGNRTLMSLAEITAVKAGLDELIGTLWQRDWIPFLDDGRGNYTVIDLSPEGRGRLLNFYHQDGFRKVVNSSIEEWIEELADSMNR